MTRAAALLTLLTPALALGCARGRASSPPPAAGVGAAQPVAPTLCDDAMPAIVDEFAAVEGPLLDLAAPATSALASSLDLTAITAVVRDHNAELRACYQAGLDRDPNLAGRLVVRWTIAHGAVEDVELRDADLADACVVRCVLEAITTWEFPRLRAVEAVTVAYPFRFDAP